MWKSCGWKVALVWMLGTFVGSSWGCINTYEPPSQQAVTRSRELLNQLRGEGDRQKWASERDRLRQQLEHGGDFRAKNDLAAALLHTGGADEAVRLLEELEKEHPGLYRTAANLGTAYELLGRNEAALEWIRRGLEREPTSHEGTEWLHVLILEAKLAQAQDPTWLGTHSVLGVRDRAKKAQPTYRGLQQELLDPEAVKKALVYQLHERIPLVPPPDLIVADLLFELSNLVSLESPGKNGAAGVTRLASEYLRESPEKVDRLEVQTYVFSNAHRRDIQTITWAGILLTPLSLGAMAVLFPYLAIRFKRWLE